LVAAAIHEICLDSVALASRIQARREIPRGLFVGIGLLFSFEGGNALLKIGDIGVARIGSLVAG
jgi:hypothetical protein